MTDGTANPVPALRAAIVAAALLVAGCFVDDGEGRPDALSEESRRPNPASLPTLPGGVDLVETEPASVLVGDGLSFGAPLPSEQLATEAFTTQPEVTAAHVRRVYRAEGPRYVGTVTVLTLDGAEVFDDAALAAFEGSLVGSLGGATSAPFRISGTTVDRADGTAHTAIGFRHGNQLVVVRGAEAAEVVDVVSRQLSAIAAGAAGSLDPATPLLANGIETAYVPVPTVSFAAIPPPEEEAIQPEPPALPGATGVHGRYGVVAGERRTTVWVLTVDPASYLIAEALDAALPALVSSRAGESPAAPAEVIDRVVLTATGVVDGDDDTFERSAAVFRHGGLVVLVEGARADQVQSVVTAWIAVLSAQRL